MNASLVSRCLVRLYFICRVRKCNPNIGHFILCKNIINQLYLGSQESYVFNTFFYGCFCALPKSCTFNVYSYVINVAISSCQSHSIFAFSASSSKQIGLLLPKTSFHFPYECSFYDLFSQWLNDIGEFFVLSKTFQFILASQNMQIFSAKLLIPKLL